MHMYHYISSGGPKEEKGNRPDDEEASWVVLAEETPKMGAGDDMVLEGHYYWVWVV